MTRASGKTHGVYFRWAANTRARKPTTAFAHNSRLQSRWAGQLYANAASPRQTQPSRHPHRRRAWLRVIWTCWHTSTPTTPRHLAASRT